MNFFAIFFRNFLSRVEYERNLGLNFFFSFSAYIILFWLKIMPEIGFLIFWLFLLFFSEFSCPGRVWTEFATKIFFSLFLGLYQPVLAKNNAGKCFFNFLKFFAILLEFSCPGRVWTEFGTKISFSFLAYIIPVLATNNAGNWFFNFLNFFAIVFWNFHGRVG